MHIKKACIICTGCPESRIDSTRVRNFFIANGWTITDEVEEADLVLFRACGLKNEDQNNAIKMIEDLKSKKKWNSELIVWGCLPKININALRKVHSGITFGANEMNILDKILEAKIPISEIKGNYCMPSEIGPFHKRILSKLKIIENLFFLRKEISVSNDSIFQIKVSSGCLDSCTFCSVRKSRGAVRSKTVDEIVAEFQDGLDKGFQYFGLLGTDLGAYGRDLGLNLVDLLLELIKKEGNYKIGLRNVNPCFLIEMFDRLRPIFASGKIWFLSSSVESGSNRILKCMKRRYKVQDFAKCIRVLNDEYPNIYLRTQVMVGFPGETEQDFKMTLKLFDELKFDWVEIYRYSRNIGTPAASFPNQISEKTKASRSRRLFLKTRLRISKRKKSYF